MKLSMCRPLLLTLFVLLSPLRSYAEEGPAGPVLLAISGEVEHPMQVRASDLSRLPRQKLRASAHGKESLFEGVALIDVLKLAGVPTGESLRGNQLVKYVLVEARDDYRVVFSLAELDSALIDREVLLADRRDGSALPAEEGPLRIVVAGEKRPVRWIRQVREIRVGSIK